MSSFLNQFDNDDFDKKINKNPQKPNKVKRQTEDQSNKVIEDNVVLEEDQLTTNESIELTNEDKNLLDLNNDYLADEEVQITPTLLNTNDETHEEVEQDSDELMIIDPNFKKKQKKKRIIISLVSILALLLLIMIFLLNNLVTVPNFKNKNVEDAMTWAKLNKITLVIKEDFSTTKEEFAILKQDKKAKSRLFKGKSLIVNVSKGPDPDEKITLPDFSKTQLKEVQDLIDEQKLYGINLELVYDAKIPKNTFISAKFGDELVDATNYKRSDSLKLTYSKGVKPIEKNIKVPDFKKKNKVEVEEWAKKNNVVVNFTEQINDTIELGLIASQSIAADEMIAEKTVIDFVVSKGKGIIVPNFANYNAETAASAQEGISVNVTTCYSDYAYGTLLSQSIGAGVMVSSDNSKVNVVYSEGRPFIDSLVGKNKKEVEMYQATMNAKGANITFVFYTAGSNPDNLPHGSVVSASTNNDYVGFNAIVYVYFAN